MLRLVAGRIVEASRVIWRRGVILWEALLPDERSFTSSSSRVEDVVFSGKVADGVKEVPTTSLQRVVLLGIRVLCCGLFGQKSGRWWVSRKRCQLIDYIPSFYFRYRAGFLSYISDFMGVTEPICKVPKCWGKKEISAPLFPPLPPPIQCLPGRGGTNDKTFKKYTILLFAAHQQQQTLSSLQPFTQ